jgi:hypothetical protein
LLGEYIWLLEFKSDLCARLLRGLATVSRQKRLLLAP